MKSERLSQSTELERILTGSDLSPFWILPFLGVLSSLIVGPLNFKQKWDAYHGQIMIGWSLVTMLIMMLTIGEGRTIQTVLTVILHHYVPFIVLISSLYRISSKICITFTLKATPLFNTTLILFSTLMSNFIGTTGSTILFIRPLLQANDYRHNRKHLVIFFIFLTANIGGSLTPIGDPPLFLGFLNGIEFFWITHHMLVPMATCTIPILIIFYYLDLYLIRLEIKNQKNQSSEIFTESNNFSLRKIKIEGKINFFLFACVLTTILVNGFLTLNVNLIIDGINFPIQNLIRDILILFFMFLAHSEGNINSYPKKNDTELSWKPIAEVAQVFLAIFITSSPVISILEAGSQGAFSRIIFLLNDQDQYTATLYFWMTGLISAFLDNAPTYLVFFHLAGCSQENMAGSLPIILLAISSGSVFMGALTYIGNAPNLLIKSIAEAHNVCMPGFFGYMKWSFSILLPLFLLINIIFF